MGKMKKSIKVIVAAITVLLLIYLICVLCAWLGGEAISLDFLIKLLFQWLVGVVIAIIICAVTSGLVSWTLKDE